MLQHGTFVVLHCFINNLKDRFVLVMFELGDAAANKVDTDLVGFILGLAPHCDDVAQHFDLRDGQSWALLIRLKRLASELFLRM